MDGLHSQHQDIGVMDPAITGLSASPYPDASMPPQQDVDEYLRKKRKAREHKACYPCRQRKVKCDLTRPCQTCRDREHPDLCSYHPPSKRQMMDQQTMSAVAAAASAATMREEGRPEDGLAMQQQASPFVTIGRSEFDMLCRKLNGLEESIMEMRQELRQSGRSNTHHDAEALHSANVDPAMGSTARQPSHTDVHGVHMKTDTGDYIHVGGASIPALLYNLQVDQSNADVSHNKEMLSKNVLELFGLDNETATYPFVDLWALPHGSAPRGQEIAKALPGDAQLLHLFRCYKDTAHVVYAGVAALEQFEAELGVFMVNRNAQLNSEAGVTEQQAYGQRFPWLSLLFAVLASGAQVSSMPRKERELTSQVYLCCSFECLRFTNFLSQCNLDALQALVIMGNVLTNNLNAGTAWSLLGLIIRLAQGLGVHRACSPGVAKEISYYRSKIWWSIIWQDSMLSITYDRNSSLDVGTMPPPEHYGPTSAYHTTMYRISKVGLDIVADRAKPMDLLEQVARIGEHRDELARIMRESAQYLRDSRQCNSARETLEHWDLYLHSSYHMSELCRPAIHPNADPDLAKFKQTCIDNLVNTVEAFLGLNNVSVFARQSWVVLHRALGSALLLGITGEHARNDRAHRLVARFMNVMDDIINNFDPNEVSRPIHRGLNALRNLAAAETDPFRLAQQQKHGHVTGPSPPESSTSSSGEEHSPYSVLNLILWGKQDLAATAYGGAGGANGVAMG